MNIPLNMTKFKRFSITQKFIRMKSNNIPEIVDNPKPCYRFNNKFFGKTRCIKKIWHQTSVSSKQQRAVNSCKEKSLALHIGLA